MSLYCDDSDGPSYYRTKEVVGRKEHPCIECTAKINKGEKHLVIFGIWDGEISQMRQHLLCQQACEYIRDELQGGSCIGFGALKDWRHSERRTEFEKTPLTAPARNMIAKILRRERNASTT